VSKTPETFRALMLIIKEQFHLPARADGKAGRKLGLTSGRTSQCLRRPPVAKKTWARLYRQLWKLAHMEGVRKGRQEATDNLLRAVEHVLDASSNTELAEAFQVTNPSITHWKQGTSAPTVTSIKKLLRELAKVRIRKLAELAPIEPLAKRGGWWIDRDSTHREKWRRMLQGRKGVYLFYDSLGRVTYVGKTSAETNDLFKEIEQRLKTGELRGIHFGKNLLRLNGKKKPRQGHIAKMLSVYEIMDIDSIHNIEALLIRAFMNTHFNNNLEKFK